MMKIWFFIAFLIIAFCDSFNSTDIECSYNNSPFIIVGDVYYCNVINEPIVLTPQSAQNCTISGQHKSVKTNDDVIGFYAGGKTFKFFPQGLERYFKNIQRFYINSCKLEEIHQSDLKPFMFLSHFYITWNLIEIIEEGLFDYNPNLKWVGFSESNIIHIDGNVFDNLKNLKTFWLETVPCVMKKVDNSYEKVKEVIIVVKRQCRNSEFMEIEDKMKNLESESKTLNIGEFNEKLELFEKSFIISKFSKYRPLNYKLENLKKLQSSSSSISLSSNLQSEPLLDQKVCPKADYSTEMLMSDLKNISDLLKDIKSTQCGITDPFLNINMSMTTITSKINDLTSSQDQLKISQNNAASSIDVKLKELKESQNSQKSALDVMKESISDMEATLSNVKTSQNDFKSSLSKIKTSQNEIRIALDELKVSKSENSGDELAEIRGKLEGLEGYFLNFEVKNADKLEKMEKEIVNSQHKMEIKLDEKIKGIEKRIMKKFEEVLEEKLEKFLRKN